MNCRSRFRILVSCLLAGALVNLLVAWGFTIHADVMPRFSRSVEGDEARELWLQLMPALTPDQPSGFLDSRCGYESLTLFNSKNAASGEKFVIKNDGSVIRYMTGWPMKTLTMRLVCPTPGLEHMDECHFELSWTSPISVAALNIRKDHQFPYCPIWPGLIVNTVFYTAIIWLIVRSPAEARRRVRQWRGATSIEAT